MIWLNHDMSTCEDTIYDRKNQDLCVKRGNGYMVFFHKNLLYGDL